MLLQMVMLVFIALGLSNVIRVILGPPVFKSGIECVLVQGGYSQQDYFLVDHHPILGKKIAQKYVDYASKIIGARFVVLPESAFPFQQIENSGLMQTLKDIALVKNEYIMTGILLEENGKIYNASALINPDGLLQNIYRKRTPVLFVETSKFARGIKAETFLVDGHSIAPVICYESLYIRDYFRDHKPELYIVISNDIFAEKAFLSRLH
jgi:apolipoprotein N-acyltransferase